MSLTGLVSLGILHDRNLLPPLSPNSSCIVFAFSDKEVERFYSNPDRVETTDRTMTPVLGE